MKKIILKAILKWTSFCIFASILCVLCYFANWDFEIALMYFVVCGIATMTIENMNRIDKL